MGIIPYFQLSAAQGDDFFRLMMLSSLFSGGGLFGGGGGVGTGTMQNNVGMTGFEVDPTAGRTSGSSAGSSPGGGLFGGLMGLLSRGGTSGSGAFDEWKRFIK